MADNNNKIQNILKTLPSVCGVYKMMDKQGKVIYVGKAKNLKKRVSSYFRKSDLQSGFSKVMVPKVSDIEYIETESELEALILENNVIKELKPKYNIQMKDDKNFSYIKVTLNEDFPRICVVRQVDKDGAKYFGPKTSVSQVKETLDLVRKLFPVRNCTLGIKDIGGEVEITRKTINYPCLEYHIKKCVAPCIGNCSRDEYKELISNVVDFLSGRVSKFLKELQKKMQEAALNKKFEQAASLRDKFMAITKVMEKQKISVPDHLFQDVIGFATEGDKTYFNLFMVRDGRLVSQENFVLEGEGGSLQVLESFLKQYYLKASDIPAEILISEKIEDKSVLEKWLSDLKKEKIKIILGKNSHDKNLLNLSKKNAQSYARQMRVKWEQDEKRTSGANEELSKMLKIKKLRRIECYDISHLSGKDAVGSMVVFENGKPKNKDYRHFKLKSVQGKVDDYKALEEVLERRLKYLDLSSKDYRFSKAGKKDWEKILAIIKRHVENKGIFDCSDLKREQFRMMKKGEERSLKKSPSILLRHEFEREQTVGRGCSKLRFGKAASDLRGSVLNGTVTRKSCGQRSQNQFGASSKEIVAFGRLKRLDDDNCVLKTMWVSKEERGKKLGYLFMKKLILGSKFKKVYALTFDYLGEYYRVFGFVDLKGKSKVVEPEVRRAKRECCGSPLVQVLEVSKLKKVDSSFAFSPDLMVVDGGKGQLASSRKVLKKFGLKIPIMALAKKEEEIFLERKSLKLDKGSLVLQLVQRLRDEAHRFAITYNRGLRNKNIVQSALDTIPGIGDKIRTKLLNKFGSVARIKEASVDDLSKVVGKKLAERIKEGL